MWSPKWENGESIFWHTCSFTAVVSFWGLCLLDPLPVLCPLTPLGLPSPDILFCKTFAGEKKTVNPIKSTQTHHLLITDDVVQPFDFPLKGTNGFLQVFYQMAEFQQLLLVTLHFTRRFRP